MHETTLQGLGRMFVTVGMSEVAVSCFLKAGQTKEAIDACVQLNQVIVLVYTISLKPLYLLVTTFCGLYSYSLCPFI